MKIILYKILWKIQVIHDTYFLSLEEKQKLRRIVLENLKPWADSGRFKIA